MVVKTSNKLRNFWKDMTSMASIMIHILPYSLHENSQLLWFPMPSSPFAHWLVFLFFMAMASVIIIHCLCSPYHT